MLRGTLHRLLDAHHFVGDPLLQPHQWREVGAPAADLLEESGEERRRERRRMMNQVVEDATELVGAQVLGGEQARDPAIGLLRVRHVGDGAQGHVADVLEIAHAQHRRHGPEFSHSERCDALIRANDQLEQGGVEPAIGVGNEFDGQLVDARIAGQRARCRELRQLVVVTAWQRRANLAYLLDDDVEVVEQPLARRADGDAIARGAAEHPVRTAQHPLRRGEASEERAPSLRTPAAWRVHDFLLASQMPAVPREAIRAEQLSQNYFTRGICRPHVAEAGRVAPPATW